MSLDILYYAPVRNRILVPVRTMLQAPERLLRIAVAHECGHFKRRWVSLLARTELAQLHEEVLADHVAIQLTGATLDEFDTAVREIPKACPASIQSALQQAFATYWAAPALLANAVRVALERLMDEQNIPPARSLDIRLTTLLPRLTLHGRPTS